MCMVFVIPVNTWIMRNRSKTPTRNIEQGCTTREANTDLTNSWITSLGTPSDSSIRDKRRYNQCDSVTVYCCTADLDRWMLTWLCKIGRMDQRHRNSVLVFMFTTSTARCTAYRKTTDITFGLTYQNAASGLHDSWPLSTSLLNSVESVSIYRLLSPCNICIDTLCNQRTSVPTTAYPYC